MPKRECLKSIEIGQSATKPRTEESSTTIPGGSRRGLINRAEMAIPCPAGLRYSLILHESSRNISANRIHMETGIIYRYENK